MNKPEIGYEQVGRLKYRLFAVTEDGDETICYITFEVDMSAELGISIYCWAELELGENNE